MNKAKIVHYANRSRTKEYVVIITDDTDEQDHVEPGFSIEQIVNIVSVDGFATLPTDQPLRGD